MSPRGRGHLSSFVSLHLSRVVSQPGCLARLFGSTDSFVFRCLDVWHGSPGRRVHLSPLSPFVCLPLSLSLDAWHAPPHKHRFICPPLTPTLDACHGSLGGRVHLSSPHGRIHLSAFVSLHLSAWVSGTALCADGFICLPLVASCSGTGLSVSRCLPAWKLSTRVSGWTGSFVSHCHPA